MLAGSFKSTLGSSTSFTFTGTGDLNNGISYLVKFTLEDGDQSYRVITFDLGSGLKLGIGYDQVIRN